jgi:hypothetical protein
MPMNRAPWPALTFTLLLLLPTAGARAAVTTWRCVNPNSGAAWNIRIDDEKKLVDSFPAEIAADRVEWHDTVGGGHYSLDRATGALTMRSASSTGGYFLYDRCARR